MSVLSRLRRRGTQTEPLRWETIDASATADHPDLLVELLAPTRDGITITGVFSQDEIDAALQRLEGVQRIERPFGWLLGMPIGMVGAAEDLSEYFEDNQRALTEFTKAFGFAPHDRVAQILEPMAAGLRMVAPTDGTNRYNPGQIRWWEPGGGGLPAHVGNEFREQLADGAMRHLLTVTDVADHLSYFVVLQEAESGGALSVYDLVWDQNTGAADFIDCQREDDWIEQYRSQQFSLRPGDMVVFGGGWRWHRVDPVYGSTPRITYGGFAAPSVDGAELNFWA